MYLLISSTVNLVTKIHISPICMPRVQNPWSFHAVSLMSHKMYFLKKWSVSFHLLRGYLNKPQDFYSRASEAMSLLVFANK